jgi:hypothetical protein
MAVWPKIPSVKSQDLNDFSYACCALVAQQFVRWKHKSILVCYILCSRCLENDGTLHLLGAETTRIVPEFASWLPGPGLVRPSYKVGRVHREAR